MISQQRVFAEYFLSLIDQLGYKANKEDYVCWVTKRYHLACKIKAEGVIDMPMIKTTKISPLGLVKVTINKLENGKVEIVAVLLK